MATLVHDTLCVSFGGLSKVYRACGYRVGWAVFSGDRRHAGEYLDAVELLSALRLCSNVPAQWAVQTALGGYQSIRELIAPEGRLSRSREAVINAVRQSQFLQLSAPRGAIYAFPSVDSEQLPGFNDHRFAMDMLEQQHVLLVPGSSFNVPYHNHFRVTFLPRAGVIDEVFGRMEQLLESYAQA
jgi:alanine-synthesizing transaminase